MKLSTKKKSHGTGWLISAAAAAAAVTAGGCALDTVAQGVTAKNISGNGTVIDSHVGINAETKIPELRTVFISGDIATTKAGTNAVSYREESAASMWNAQSITRKRFLSITLTDAGDVPAAIRAVADVIARETEEPQSGTEARNAAE